MTHITTSPRSARSDNDRYYLKYKKYKKKKMTIYLNWGRATHRVNARNAHKTTTPRQQLKKKKTEKWGRGTLTPLVKDTHTRTPSYRFPSKAVAPLQRTTRGRIIVLGLFLHDKKIEKDGALHHLEFLFIGHPTCDPFFYPSSGASLRQTDARTQAPA